MGLLRALTSACFRFPFPVCSEPGMKQIFANWCESSVCHWFQDLVICFLFFCGL